MKKLSLIAIASLVLCITSCQQQTTEKQLQTYFDTADTGILTGGVKMVPIKTPKGEFKVWTKRFGNHPKIKVLLLNGGPGATHEYFECMENFLPKEGIEFIYYDQLGTGNSDNPKDTTMWDLPRFVEEVEQVRTALKLDKNNFYLLGHSWGGILAMQYALKYQQNLKGLIISNMMSSCPAYGKYADEVLAKQMDPNVVKKVKALEAAGKYTDPEYMGLLMPNFYAKHILRQPISQWPEPVNRSFAKMNQSLYVTMQGPSEFGISGKLLKWDVSAQLKNITVPALSIGAQYDTMDPKHMEWMASEFKNGSYLYCKNGSHMSLYDDQQTYMKGIIKFMKGVDQGERKIKFN
jgi:proline iminopeptidase